MRVPAAIPSSLRRNPESAGCIAIPTTPSPNIEPIGASAVLSSKIVKNAQLKIYKGAPHGMPSTLNDQINADLLVFNQNLGNKKSPKNT
jgi:hypothetical protein